VLPGAPRSAAKTMYKACLAKQKARGFAVADVKLTHDGVELCWKEACTYNAAMPWVTSAWSKHAVASTIDKSFWTLTLLNAVDREDAAEAVKKRRKIDTPADTEATATGHQAEQQPIAEAADPKASVPSAAGPAKELQPEDTAVEPSEPTPPPVPTPALELKTRVSQAAPAYPWCGPKAWLVRKATELVRDAPMSPRVSSFYNQYVVTGNKIASGTFGSVYKGSDSSGRAVAVKVLRPDNLCDFSYILEIDVLSRLTHPNVVVIQDVFLTEQKNRAIVLEYSGPSLLALLRQKSLGGAASANQLMVQLCDGLSFVHANLIAHTDLKPGNLAVDSAGRLRILDFGTAVVTLSGFRSERQVVDTKRGLPYGTLQYRAPEVCLGDVGFGSEADLWASGFDFELVSHAVP